MIRNSAKRFVDAARDVDRIALVTFTDQPALYSSFTLDRQTEKDDRRNGRSDWRHKLWDSMDWVERSDSTSLRDATQCDSCDD